MLRGSGDVTDIGLFSFTDCDDALFIEVLRTIRPEIVLLSSLDGDDALLRGAIGPLPCPDGDVLRELGVECDLSWSAPLIDELMLDELVERLVETPGALPLGDPATMLSFLDELFDDLLLFELETVSFFPSDCDDSLLRGVETCSDRDVLRELGAEFDVSWSATCIDELLLDELVELLLKFFDASFEDLLLLEFELWCRLRNPIVIVINSSW